MHWIYKGLTAVAMVGASLVTAGILPVSMAVVATAIGSAAMLFHSTPNSTKTPPP